MGTVAPVGRGAARLRGRRAAGDPRRARPAQLRRGLRAAEAGAGGGAEPRRAVRAAPELPATLRARLLARGLAGRGQRFRRERSGGGPRGRGAWSPRDSARPLPGPAPGRSGARSAGNPRPVSVPREDRGDGLDRDSEWAEWAAEARDHLERSRRGAKPEPL